MSLREKIGGIHYHRLTNKVVVGERREDDCTKGRPESWSYGDSSNPKENAKEIREVFH
jgi:hypothetical protein